MVMARRAPPMDRQRRQLAGGIEVVLHPGATMTSVSFVVPRCRLNSAIGMIVPIALKTRVRSSRSGHRPVSAHAILEG